MKENKEYILSIMFSIITLWIAGKYGKNMVLTMAKDRRTRQGLKGAKFK